jgi:hypothetical protein
MFAEEDSERGTDHFNRLEVALDSASKTGQELPDIPVHPLNNPGKMLGRQVFAGWSNMSISRQFVCADQDDVQVLELLPEALGCCVPSWPPELTETLAIMQSEGCLE